MDYIPANNYTDDHGSVGAREVAYYRNPWLVLYSFVLIILFISGGIVASKYSRNLEPAHIDTIVIAEPNIQPMTALMTKQKEVLLVPATAGSNVIASAAAKPVDAKSKESAQKVASIAKSLTVTIKAKDNLGRIFKRLGLSTKVAAEILALKQTKALQNLRVGNHLNLLVDPAVKSGVKGLEYSIDDLTTLVINFTNNSSWHVQEKHIKPVSTVKYVSATVGNSIYAAGKRAGISSKLMAKFVNAFGNKVNINKIGSSDKFAMFYEEHTVKDKKIGESDIVAAELTHGDKIYRVIGFAEQGGPIDFYTPDGHRVKSSFVRYPVNFNRIGSRFSFARFHPILNIVRPHLGVDLVASAGTPVKATSNGRIEFVGTRNGHGKTVIIRNGIYSTLYAHLSRFPKDIHFGGYVRQGQVIGFVGSSGLSTAPHLHYEFRINGVHHDPLKVKLPDGEMIAAEHRSRFFSLSKRMVAQFDLHRSKSHRMYAMYTGGTEPQFE